MTQPATMPMDTADTSGPSPSRQMSISEAIAMANACFLRAVLLHYAASQLVTDFAGEEPKYHTVGAFGVERRVPPEQLQALVEELHTAAAAARAEAERVLGGAVTIDSASVPSLVPESPVDVAPKVELLPPLDDCVLNNPRSIR
jgi:hypothetical protein